MNAMPRVDVVVPFGHAPGQPERQANLRRVLTDLRHTLTYPNHRVVLAELGAAPSQRQLARELDLCYVFTRTDDEFSPGRAMNEGFLRRPAPADLVYFHQADFLVAGDVVDRAVHRMESLDCPFVYPYWGEIHLSAPVSQAVRGRVVPAGPLLDVFRRSVAAWRAAVADQSARLRGYDEFVLPDDELDSVLSLLPANLSRDLLAADHTALWGTDDRPYAPYRWEPSDTTAARVCRISGGPRASAAYLCRDPAFRRVGGVPELSGWGFEELAFWCTVQAFFPYRGDRHGLLFADQPITLGDPLVHLWHPVGGRPGYYAATARNEQLFNEIRTLPAARIRERVRPLSGRET